MLLTQLGRPPTWSSLGDDGRKVSGGAEGTKAQKPAQKRLLRTQAPLFWGDVVLFRDHKP